MQKGKEPLVIGREYLQDGEEARVAVMVQEMKDQLDRLYKDEMTARQVHNKMHGCVKAEFIIECGLPAQYRVGVFKEERSFPAWVRFSNGNTKIQADNKRDTRGAAIKLMNVAGEKLMDTEKCEQTQDFVLSGSKVFFAKDLKDFHGLMTASISESKLALPLYFLTHPKILVRALSKMLLPCKHPFETEYNSISPYRFGDESKAVKYNLTPAKSNVVKHTDSKDYNYLRKSMVATLDEQDILFDFGVQFQEDADTMPIEDGTVEWKSPVIKLATLRIPKQEFDTPAQWQFGENLTYNVWHSLAEHRPLGGFNRGRKAIYEQMYKYRLDKNEVILAEPTAGPDFLTNLTRQ